MAKATYNVINTANTTSGTRVRTQSAGGVYGPWVEVPRIRSLEYTMPDVTWEENPGYPTNSVTIRTWGDTTTGPYWRSDPYWDDGQWRWRTYPSTMPQPITVDPATISITVDSSLVAYVGKNGQLVGIKAREFDLLCLDCRIWGFGDEIYRQVNEAVTIGPYTIAGHEAYHYAHTEEKDRETYGPIPGSAA